MRENDRYRNVMTDHEDQRPDDRPARRRLLDAADTLFYAHGINATGVDAVITAADVARMTFYRNFGGKADLVTSYLEGRDLRWRTTLEDTMANADHEPRAQLLAMFDTLKIWHSDPRFRGCSFANAAAELADADHPARAVVTTHKYSLHERMIELACATGHPHPELLTDQLMMLFEGATTAQALGIVTDAAAKARATAEQLIPHA